MGKRWPWAAAGRAKQLPHERAVAGRARGVATGRARGTVIDGHRPRLGELEAWRAPLATPSGPNGHARWRAGRHPWEAACEPAAPDVRPPRAWRQYLYGDPEEEEERKLKKKE
jgi:hypothetical protein